jgi:2-succinyl-5-enolpyruvyl-6-hydroxy-3-cyclohexene-1-carboxylate synthase
VYCDDKNAQIVLALLKAYGIKKVVVSPGMTNVPITRSVQIDPWFEVYSVVDERSAAYFACGLADESGEPVVISCTGATASRNYLPGLTEAYYRQLPVIALTSQRHTSDYGNLVPQITDRTISQNDVKKISVHLPVVKDEEDTERCIISVNKALIKATTRGMGPVHINLPVDSFAFNTKELPDVRKIRYYDSLSIITEAEELREALRSKKIAIFIGAHKKFDKNTQIAIDSFASRFNAAVITDQTSRYHAKNCIPLAQIADLKQSSNIPDIVIDMGSITGEYSIGWLFNIETWRLSEDGEIHDRFHKQTKLFDCPEGLFFSTLTDKSTKALSNYYKSLINEIQDIKVPDLPLSNTLVAYELSKHIPKYSNLHLGILNSLRNMNLFNLDETIDVISNVGGFGIDGPLSTLIGQSMVDKSKITFGLIGDLAAFYDMNALGIRHIGNNVRILLVNNNGGVEFRLNAEIEEQLAEATNEFISASGHNGSMKAWSESMGFEYVSARTKEDLHATIPDFCDANVGRYKRPVLFEVFTDFLDEQQSLEMIRSVNRDQKHEDVPQAIYREFEIKKKIRNGVKRIAPNSAKRIYKGFRKK